MASVRGWMRAAVAALALAGSGGAAAAEAPVYEFGVLPQVSTDKLAEAWVPFLAKLSAVSGVELKLVTAPSINEFGARANAGAYAFYYHNTLAYVQHEELYKAFAREVGAKMLIKEDGSISGTIDAHETVATDANRIMPSVGRRTLAAGARPGSLPLRWVRTRSDRPFARRARHCVWPRPARSAENSV